MYYLPQAEGVLLLHTFDNFSLTTELGHHQMYYLPQAEGVLLHTFDNRSRVCG